MTTKLKPCRAFCAASIRLEATVEDANVRADIETKSGAAPRWMQVGAEGEFLGHQSGPFTLGAEEFGQVVHNFRAHPSFKAGADGTGIARVVAVDFGHASEQPPERIAVLGAPAQAWALDLETRTGESGVLQLWSLTEFLEPAASYVAEGRYAWCSMALWPDVEDPRTGKPIGWYMSSIALTNDPFIQGMVPIAAMRGLEMYWDPYNLPTEPQGILDAIKGLFELAPDAPLADVATKLAELRSWTTGGAVPPAGVDAAAWLSKIGLLLRLPALAAPDEIFAELDKMTTLIAAALPPQPPPPASPPVPPAPPQAPPPPRPQPAPGTGPTTQERGNHMSLLKTLAGRFKIPADEAEIEKAVMLALETGEQAKTMLEQLMEALGKKPLEKARELLALKDLIPHIEQLLGGQLEAEEKSVDEDVEAVTAGYHVPAEFKTALVAQRRGPVPSLKLDGCMKVVEGTIGPQSPHGRTPLQLRAEARKAFAECYPVAFARPGDPTHLTMSLATRSSAEPHSTLLRALGPSRDGGLGFRGQPALPAPPPGAARNGGGELAQLAQQIDGFPGRNHVEKAMAFLREQPGGAKKHLDQLSAEAFALCRNIRTALAS
jgi:hypothetical protein